MITIDVSSLFALAIVALAVLVGVAIALLTKHSDNKGEVVQNEGGICVTYDEQGGICVINTDSNGDQQVHVTDSDGEVIISQSIKGKRLSNIVQVGGVTRGSKGRTIISQSVKGYGHSNIIQAGGDIYVEDT